ncbi:MAG: tRNA-modifying protein YgfZ [Polymorphum sp.]|uniref:Glycine cleavage system protein T n=1 Tax=Pannonibacter phragmitetus TaxID=121719 RepID=A0A0U3PF06_9HYPH|nr:folate-binding protein YgfZ [Pannonibacter phragmitetus]ALV25789.1 glycine cleavage system protein T [Pannonibacter phragmitetus]MBA4206526.1 tRNA-modifying protein YgfZ [Polymorphum sp.]
MSAARFALLPDRGLVRVSGPEATHFLQNLLTRDVEGLTTGEAAFAALLTPQGKILFDFLVLKDADGFLLDTPASQVAALVKRLGFYRLRAKVTLEDCTATHEVAVVFGDALPAAPLAPDILAAADPRLAALGLRVAGPKGLAGILEGLGLQAAEPADWHAHRIGLGVPEAESDFAYGEIFPHDADMDQLNGVSFRKGCYVGQEIVSRMEHRSTARKRFVRVEAAEALPAMGSPVLAGEQEVGTLGSSSGGRGLALLRLDKVKAALDKGVQLTAAGTALDVTLPGWARFTWPESGSGAGTDSA